MVLDNITKGYGDKVVLDNFSCKFDDKKITIIMGESGVGKTTLLNLIAGLTDYSGKLECCKNVSYLFHNDRLIPNLTVEENLKFIVKDINVDKELEKVDLLNAKEKFPIELSAGMSRRVSLLRTINYPAELLLLDEPFSNLDYYLKYKLMDLIKEKHKITNNTIIMVTHDIDEAIYLADRVIILSGGKIKKDFTTVSSDTKDEILEVFLKK